jgi:hypothetical protein
MTLKKISHQFAHPELSYEAKPNIQPCIKLTFYFNKLPEVSYDQFYGHWSTVHADLSSDTTNLIGQSSSLRVRGAHTTPASGSKSMLTVQALSIGYAKLSSIKFYARFLSLLHSGFRIVKEVWNNLIQSSQEILKGHQTEKYCNTPIQLYQVVSLIQNGSHETSWVQHNFT